MVFLRLKAGLIVFLIIFSVFSIYVPVVGAEARKACCQNTESGDHCVYTDPGNCDLSGTMAFATCEQTNFCNLGCCYSSNDGSCNKNVPKAVCDSKDNAAFIESPECNIAACQKGCCLIGEEAFFVTQTQCKQYGSQFPDLKINFDSGVATEKDCLEKARSKEVGCCVTEDSCTFTTRDACNTANENIKGSINPPSTSSTPSSNSQESTASTQSNTKTATAKNSEETAEGSEKESPPITTSSLEIDKITGNAEAEVQKGTENAQEVFIGNQGFYKNTLCSNDKLQCGCAKQHHTACYQGRVYWYDSCGNRENIYDANKAKSFNNGFVLPIANSCKAKINDKNCGNCEYSEGNLCGQAPKDVKPKYGDLTCNDLNCYDTYSDKGISPNAGEDKKHGESWCLYDKYPGLSGDALGDRPGARHYRHLCIAGEEIVEPCEDFRNQLCIQGVLGKEVLETQPSFELKQGDYVEAACRKNRFEDCSKFKFKSECKNVAYSDCYWMEAGIVDFADPIEKVGIEGEIETTNPGMCVPLVPPGLKFWPGNEIVNLGREVPEQTQQAQQSNAASSSPSGLDAKEICNKASRECIVMFVKRALPSIAGPKYECLENCHCLEEDWIIGAYNLCTSQGDCGAKRNILDKLSMTGIEVIDEKNNRKFTSDMLGKKAVALKGIDPEEPEFFTRLDQNKGWAGLLASASAGLFQGLWHMGKDDSITGTIFGGIGTALKGPLQLFELGAGGLQAIKGLLPEKQKTTGKAIAIDSITGSATTEQTKKTTKDILEGIKKSSILESKIVRVEYDFTSLTQYGIGKITEYITVNIDPNNPYDSMEYTAQSGNKYRFIRNSRTGGIDIYLSSAIDNNMKEVSIPNINPHTEKTIVETYKEPNGNYLHIDYSDTGSTERYSLFKPPINSPQSTIINFDQNGNILNEKDLTEADRALLASKGIGTPKETKAPETPKEGEGEEKPKEGVLSNFGFFDAVNIVGWLYTIYSMIDLATTNYETYKVSVTCNPWVAPLGGKDCEKCNEKFKPCSEYKCRSLGQTCRLINPGTDEEKCINMHPNDVNSPIITPNLDALTKGYTIKDSGPNIGFEITQKVEPYSPLSIGINTNEPAQCKYSMNASMKYDEMNFMFGSTLFLYNQTMIVSLPSELANEQVLKNTHGIYTLYIKCMDASGNKNNRDYFIKLKIKPGKDLTPPIIEGGSLKNGAYIAANIKETAFSLYTNEPASCRYSENDVPYENMKDEFTCSESGFQAASTFYSVYECRTMLKNLKEGTNSFNFRCKDLANNANQESFKFSLIGTKELLINSTAPSGELMDNNITLEVFTKDGAENGKAVCGYKPANSPYIEFKNTNSNHHSEEVTLNSGSYSYPVTCNDIAGNEAKASIIFKVTKDVQAPRLVFVYKDATAGLLHIELNEITTCEYSVMAPFKFGDGTKMTNENSKVHEASIAENQRKFYIVCQDVFKNEYNFIVYP